LEHSVERAVLLCFQDDFDKHARILVLSHEVNEVRVGPNLFLSQDVENRVVELALVCVFNPHLQERLQRLEKNQAELLINKAEVAGLVGRSKDQAAELGVSALVQLRSLLF
jgi:hypothetical protein